MTEGEKGSDAQARGPSSAEAAAVALQTASFAAPPQKALPKGPNANAGKAGGGGKQRGSLSSAKARAKKMKAVQRGEKLALKKSKKELRAERSKAAKS